MLSNYQLNNLHYTSEHEAGYPGDSESGRGQAYEHVGVCEPVGLGLEAAYSPVPAAPGNIASRNSGLVRNRALSPANTPNERATLARAKTADMLAFAFSNLFSFDVRLVARPYPAPRLEPLGYDMLPELTLNPLLRPWEATVKDAGQGTQVHPLLALAIDIQLGFETLSHTERLFVTHHYGFKRTYAEIGQTVGRSEHWVKKIATVCLAKLAPYVIELAELDKLVSDAARLALGLDADAITGSPAVAQDKSKAAPDSGKKQAAAGNKKKKKGNTNLKLAGYEQGYNDLIADSERWWESEADREVREARQAGGQALTDSMRLESSLFVYLRQRPAQEAGQPVEHGVSEAEAEHELFFVKMPRGVERGFSRVVLLSKLGEFARRGTAITEEIMRRLVDPEIGSGLDASKFAREFGYNYGQVVQVKKDLLGRVISWMQDTDLPVSYYRVRSVEGYGHASGASYRRRSSSSVVKGAA